MRLLVTGSQKWIRVDTIELALLAETIDIPPRGVTLVHGACPDGADQIADEFAVARGWDIERHPADWSRHGRAAGQIRNQRMVKSGVDVCLAFIREKSPGASTTLRKAHREGIYTVVWRHEGDRVWLDDQMADIAGVSPDQGSLF